MSEQHPIPWGISESSGLLIDANGTTVIGSPAIQRYIVARVNACEGLDTESLERGTVSTLNAAKIIQEQASEMKQQRDELLAALIQAKELIESVVPFEGDVMRQIKAAITKAEAAL